MGSLTLTQIEKIPLIQNRDNIPEILFNAMRQQGIHIHNGDIIAVTSKIISKAEGRLMNLGDVVPSSRARVIGKKTKRDPRLIEIILLESNEIICATRQVIIVEHKLGFICANAGVDHSNVQGARGDNADWYLLLPKAPDKSAENIKEYFLNQSGKSIGVIIIDSHGRPWRKGTVGLTIGLSMVPALVDFRGKEDLFGYHLKITEVATADELAGAASLMMGQADEKIPAVHINGFPYPLTKSRFNNVLRPKKTDLFR